MKTICLFSILFFIAHASFAETECDNPQFLLELNARMSCAQSPDGCLGLAAVAGSSMSVALGKSKSPISQQYLKFVKILDAELKQATADLAESRKLWTEMFREKQKKYTKIQLQNPDIQDRIDGEIRNKLFEMGKSQHQVDGNFGKRLHVQKNKWWREQPQYAALNAYFDDLQLKYEKQVERLIRAETAHRDSKIYNVNGVTYPSKEIPNVKAGKKDLRERVKTNASQVAKIPAEAWNMESERIVPVKDVPHRYHGSAPWNQQSSLSKQSTAGTKMFNSFALGMPLIDIAKEKMILDSCSSKYNLSEQDRNELHGKLNIGHFG